MKIRSFLLSHLFVICLPLLSLALIPSLHAITIVSGPGFVKATAAPLAGTLSVATDVPSRVSVSVTDGTETWTRNFFDYSLTHSLPLFGFKPGRDNEITVTVHDRFNNEVTAESPVRFLTGPLPANFPVFTVLVAKTDRMEPGYNLVRCVVNSQLGYIIIVDNQGEVVWYSSMTAGSENRQLENGNLLLVLPGSLNEVNLLGETVRKWNLPSNLNLDTHDVFFTDRNSILYIHPDSGSVPNFPINPTDPNAPRQTTTVQFDRIVEVAASAAINPPVINNWSLLNLLDPSRITYLTFAKTAQGLDIHHGNAIIEDPRDDSIIVSIRDQNAVVAFKRETGQIKWILGPHENWSPAFQKYLLTPVGTPFEWNYGQHAPRITPQGTLLLYDDGNFRASPYNDSIPDSENYSRTVEYEINEATMEVKQVWEYGANVPEPLYTGSVGNAELLPKTGNILIDFGNISYVNHAHPSATSTNASMARIKEVTHDENKEVLFDLAIFDYQNHSSTYAGNWAYRCYRIPDLYSHPAVAVTDLNVTFEDGVSLLQFSADTAREYAVQASDDLRTWDELGTAESTEDGLYTFEDADAENSGNRYYRVVTR